MKLALSYYTLVKCFDRVSLGLFGFIFLWGAVLTLLFHNLHARSPWEMVACDVGQGDAILLQRGHFDILIDTGPNSSILRCLQANLSPLNTTIELLVLSHEDADHIGGLATVLQNYTVGMVLGSEPQKNTAPAQLLRDFIGSAPVAYSPKAGDRVILPGLRLTVVSPASSQNQRFSSGKEQGDANERSIGLMGEMGSFGFLSLGDLSCPAELAVSRYPLLTEIDILKASHHGSKSSSCAEFLTKIRPEGVILSVGEGNKYGHPEETVLQNIAEIGAKVLRTDLQGEIHLLPEESEHRTSVIWWAKE